jgi:hypothetical protein
VLEHGTTSTAARQAAAWGLAGHPDAQGARALASELETSSDPMILALACLGLGAADDVRPDTRRRIAILARTARPLGVRHACALAEAELASDAGLAKIAAQLESDDAVLAAIAAWRRGRIAVGDGGPDGAVVQELFTALVGPAGLRRDAAAAALARLLDGKRSAPTMERPPAPRARESDAALQRWISRLVAPSFEPLAAAALAPHRVALASALRAAASGTRAERAAATAARTACAERPAHGRAGSLVDANGDADGDAVCLRPLVRETVHLRSAAGR